MIIRSDIWEHVLEISKGSPGEIHEEIDEEISEEISNVLLRNVSDGSVCATAGWRRCIAFFKEISERILESIPERANLKK